MKRSCILTRAAGRIRDACWGWAWTAPFSVRVRQILTRLWQQADGGVLPVVAGALVGQTLQSLSSTLWPLGGSVLALGVLAAVGWLLRRLMWAAGGLAVALSVLWGVAAGFACNEVRAHLHVPRADLRAMQPGLAPQEVLAEGQIVDLPQQDVDGTRVLLRVQRWRFQRGAWQNTAGGPLVQVFWPTEGVRVALPAVRVGQRWQLPLRWRAVRGLANDTQRDPELWAWLRGVILTATVRTKALDAQGPVSLGLIAPAPSLAALLVSQPQLAIHALREAWRVALARQLAGSSDAVLGTLIALAVGDQQAIAPDVWQLYRDTGITHLMSISGLHITALAWLAARALRRVWRLSPALMRRCPAQDAGAIGGLLVAFLYALVAGWGVPAQRTVCMLAVLTALGLWRLRWNAAMTLPIVAGVVLLQDPWAWLQPGFWLSFAAVALLVLRGERLERDHPQAQITAPQVGRPWQAVQSLLAEQATLTLGLAPLTVLFFGQFSVLGLLANLVAVFWVTVLVLPLLFAGLVLPVAWSLAAALVAILLALLRALDAAVAGVWWLPLETPWPTALAWPLAALGVWLVLLGARGRWTGLFLLAPAVWPWPATPPPGRFELMALDIGQGTAVLLRTHSHTVLFDTGPVYGVPPKPQALPHLGAPPPDAGSRVIVPVLRALGVRQLNVLMNSHGDQDHIGGTASVLAALPVLEFMAALPPNHPLMASARMAGARVRHCQQGQSWDWDGVRFELIHPLPLLEQRLADPVTGLNPALGRNEGSCVLRVQDAAGRAALVTGDSGVLQEADMLWAQQRGLYRAAGQNFGPVDVVIAPHHGSHTSSSAAWLAALRRPARADAPADSAASPAAVAVVQAGAFNRYGHPHAEVLARYRAWGYQTFNTATCGAWRWRSNQSLSDAARLCWRVSQARYWQAAALTKGDP